MSARQQLEEWLHQRGFRSKHLRWECLKEDSTRGRVIFATTKNNYFLSFHGTKYLGLTVSSRVSRPGENWTRGNDLPDGGFSAKTLDKALGAVLLYELREVSDVESGGPWSLEKPTPASIAYEVTALGEERARSLPNSSSATT